MLPHLLSAVCIALTIPAFSQIVPFGVCAHLGSGEEHRDHERELALMQEAGIRWARADFTWGYFEPENDKWRFDVYDTILAASKKHDVTLLPILCYNVKWAFPAHEHMDDWCDYVATVVGRYKDDLRYWEVWNEPNIGFWKPKPNPAEYTRLLKATYETIKQIDPELQVVYGGTAGVPFDYLRKTFELGACEAFDILAVHPYRYPRVPDASGLAEDLEKTRELLDEFGSKAPVWITEFGWPTHINAVVGDGSFPAQLIHYSARLRFPDRTEFQAAVLHDKGMPGCGVLGPMVTKALNGIPGVSARLVGLADLASLDPQDTQILVMPTGEHYPADCFEHTLSFVKQGGLLAHLGGVPFYYAQRLKDGTWESPHAGEAGREPLHVGWKAWWTQEGLPKQANRTVLLAPEDSGIVLPQGVKSTRWLTDAKLKANDRFIPLLAAYNGDDLIGHPVALYLYDSELKGAFLGTILDISLRGVTDDTQGAYLPRALLVSLGAGVENLFWYEFREGGDDPTYNEARFGIIRYREMTPKPAYMAYQALTTALGKGTFIGKLDLGPETCCYVFDAGGSKTAAVWRVEGEGEGTVRLRTKGEDVRATDYLGKAVDLTQRDGIVTVAASENVVYLTGLEALTPAP